MSRVIHTFDFLEPDNLDSIPKYWIRFPDAEYSDPSFPRYTEAGFDHSTGHDAAPSFQLRSEGRNVALRYTGPDTRVRPGEFLVAGWIKPRQLEHARAAVSAYYLDWEGRFVAQTQRFSALIGGTGREDGWQRVSGRLPTAPENAHAVGITCWVVQQEVWNADMRPHREIAHRDVEGSAWFDDIVVLGIPRATLASDHPGNVVTDGEIPRLLVTIADDETDGILGRLVVRDQDGVEVLAEDVPAYRFEDSKTTVIPLPSLHPGLYRATLQLLSLGEPIFNQSLNLAVLGRSHRSAGIAVRQMGIIINRAAPDQVHEMLALVRALGVGAAKLPLWSGEPTAPGFESFRSALHAALEAMIEARVSVIGTIAGPPTQLVKSAGVHARSLLDILSEDPRAWRSYLTGMVAPYATIMRSWQLGGDGDPGVIYDPRAPSVLRSLEAVMREMVTTPNLTAITAAVKPPGERLPEARNLSVDLPADIHPAFVADHFAAYRKLGYDQLWASVPLPNLGAHDPEKALNRWARRVLEARWAKANVVFVPQLWRTRRSADQTLTEPILPYIAFHTMVDAIADLPPVGRVEIGSTGEALVFGDGTRAVLAMWDAAAPQGGTMQTLQLGTVEDVVDLFGRPIEQAQSADGRQQLRLSEMPVFVIGAEQWLMAFRMGLRLAPGRAEFSFENRPFALSVHNPHGQSLSGEVRLTAPNGWELEPRRLLFSLYPGETRDLKVSIRHPGDETAGVKTMLARVDLAADKPYRLDIPLRLELGLKDVDVWGYAVSEGDDLVVRHSVRHRADRPLSFRSFAIYPGRSRQYRTINELLPGQSTTIEYRFKGVSHAGGKRIRLGLREVNGPRVHSIDIASP